MRHIFVLGGLLVLLAATAAARAEVDPFEAFRCERAFDEARFAKADKICRPLAEAGLADAQAIMGLLYQDGRGVTRDYTEAALWYDRAARQGHREAQFNLGTMYRYGVGVARDLVEAYAWLDVAAGAGHTDAVAGRALVEKRMTTEQRDEGRRRAAELGRVVANAAAPPPAEAAQPQAAAAPPPAGSDTTQALVDGLRAAVAQAERERSADTRFLEQLRGLARAYDRPWRVTLLDDDFADGDFTAAPAWTVASGTFSVDTRYGLRNRFTPPPTLQFGSGNQDGGDAAAQLFGAILGELTQQQGSGGQARPSAAEIHTRLAITDIFSAEVEFGAFAKAIEGGGIEFGATRGAGRDTGYRLAYSQGRQPSLALLRVTPTGSSTVAQKALDAGLEDGHYHKLALRRGHGGAMEVLLDGAPVMKAVDRGARGAFDGFTLINRGGDFAFRGVTILGAN